MGPPLDLGVNRNGQQETVEVTADGEGFCSQAGALLLSNLCDRLGLTEALSEALAPTRQRRSAHEDGEILRNLIVTLAQGGEHVSDQAALRDQPDLFGDVASDATAFRAIERIGPAELEGIKAARKVARERAFALGAAPERSILDVDATLLGAHSEKEGAAGNYKGGYGFQPLLPGGLRRGARRRPATRQRRLQHGCRPGGGDRSGARAAAARRYAGGDPGAWRQRRLRARGGRLLPRGRHPLLGRARAERPGARGDRQCPRSRLGRRDLPGRGAGGRAPDPPPRGLRLGADRPPRPLRLARGLAADLQKGARPPRCPALADRHRRLAPPVLPHRPTRPRRTSPSSTAPTAPTPTSSSGSRTPWRWGWRSSPSAASR